MSGPQQTEQGRYAVGQCCQEPRRHAVFLFAHFARLLNDDGFVLFERGRHLIIVTQQPQDWILVPVPFSNGSFGDVLVAVVFLLKQSLDFRLLSRDGALPLLQHGQQLRDLQLEAPFR